MAWTTISTSVFDPDSPILGSSHLVIYNNITALANGDIGAPQIQTNAIKDSAVTNFKLATDAVTNVKVADGTLGHEKMQTDQDMNNWVGQRHAAVTNDGIGTLVLAKYALTTALNRNDIVDGDLITPCDASGSVLGSAFSSSTRWKCLGETSGSTTVTLIQRTS